MQILHYSGTGNSTYIAKKIHQKIDSEIISLNEVFRSQKELTLNDDTLVFVTPTYCWRLPRIVSEWMKRQHFRHGQKAYFVMTCGDDFGNANKWLEGLCRKTGLTCMGGIEVVMPENYITMFTAPSAELSQTIIECADLEVEEITAYLRRGERFPEREVNLRDRLFSGVVNDLFFKFIVKDKKFRVLDSCVGCGICEKGCPLNNIRLQNGRPVWNGDCTHCMACICRCPQQAIEYGKGSLGKRRYYLADKQD
ncbi:MAG: EFR1 family ferrodoxin [Bacteroidales bacterium]|nr:EFR1 family ferrodoxin [Bacteroidales bacterium]